MEEFKLKLAKSIKVLRLTIDHNLTLYGTDISNICKAASAKFKSLSKIRNALDEKQVKLEMLWMKNKSKITAKLFYFVSVQLLL